NGPPPLRGGPLRYPPAIQKRWRRIPRRSRQTLQTDVAARRAGILRNPTDTHKVSKTEGNKSIPSQQPYRVKHNCRLQAHNSAQNPSKKSQKSLKRLCFLAVGGGGGYRMVPVFSCTLDVLHV